MKSEEKIVELLAGLLKRSDQHSELLERQTDILDKHTGMFEKLLLKLDTLTEHEKRIGRLEDKVFRT